MRWWFGRSKAGPVVEAPAFCQSCVDRARAHRLFTVWVYPNGHMLDTGGALPTLAEWPAARGPRTFCGLAWNGGMGESRLYRMTGDA
jgi:hypothetical protein